MLSLLRWSLLHLHRHLLLLTHSPHLPPLRRYRPVHRLYLLYLLYLLHR
jgi:hypothetical protein